MLLDPSKAKFFGANAITEQSEQEAFEQEYAAEFGVNAMTGEVTVCRNCGMNGNHPKSNGVCPAMSESCNLCGKIGHFARKCMRNKQVRTPAMMQHGEHMQRQKANENRKIKHYS